MLIHDNQTLGEILSSPLIRPIAKDAIREMDLSKDEKWGKTLAQLKEEHFGGNLQRGFERLFGAAQSGNWYYSLYTQEECLEDPTRSGVNLVWFPSSDPSADGRPYILLVPGGGFVNVWNLTEGWPVAAQFNELGYHVFILTYRVAGEDRRLDHEMEDFARAISYIRENEKAFSVHWDRYITCGFSAGGYLVCLWNVPEKGYAASGLPKPQAVFPIYPVVSWKKILLDEGSGDESDVQLFGCPLEEAVCSPFEIPEHAEGFPPCAIFLAAGDELVPPDHSRILAQALNALHIPCRLEIGEEGGHGFADGSGMCMDGWTERAIRWYEELHKDNQA